MPKRIGRPPLPSGERKAKTFTFRIHDGMRELLTAAAAKSGRSVAEEIAARLLISFRDEAQCELIQKAVADGIAAHEAAKAGSEIDPRFEKLLRIIAREQANAEHEERCFAPRPEVVGRQYRY